MRVIVLHPCQFLESSVLRISVILVRCVVVPVTRDQFAGGFSALPRAQVLLLVTQCRGYHGGKRSFLLLSRRLVAVFLPLLQTVIFTWALEVGGLPTPPLVASGFGFL